MKRKEKTVAEYNQTAEFPVLTWNADPEFNVITWAKNNQKLTNWHRDLSVDILDINDNYIKLDEDGEVENVSACWLEFRKHNNPDEHGIWLQLDKKLWLLVIPLDGTRVEEFFEGKKCWLIPTKKQVPELHSVVISRVKYL